MFTGLIQALGTALSLTPDSGGGARLTVLAPAIAPRLELGESISVNGACLTVVAFDATTFAFDLGPETLARTTLASLIPGSRVNLERALRVGDAIGGHFVSGHIDTVGTVSSIEPSGEWRTFGFAVPEAFDGLLVAKGSIAIDGISLTLVDVTPGLVTVMLIPHTLAHTTLGSKQIGDSVNLEFDMLAKQVQKLVAKMHLPGLAKVPTVE